jgi:hypothetical protein
VAGVKRSLQRNPPFHIKPLVAKAKTKVDLALTPSLLASVREVARGGVVGDPERLGDLGIEAPRLRNSTTWRSRTLKAQLVHPSSGTQAPAKRSLPARASSSRDLGAFVDVK